MLITQETQVRNDEPFPPEVNNTGIFLQCLQRTTSSTYKYNIYIYMLCDHRAFMSPESCSRFSSTAGKPRHIPLRQTRPYQPTRSCFLFRLSLRVDPFLRWPALESCSSTYRFQLGKTWSSNLHSSTSSIYLLQHVVKTGNFVCTWSSCLCALLIIFFISGC